MARTLLIRATWDAAAGVWFTESDDLPGLALEADTLERLMERLPGAILDLMEAGDESATGEVPFEVVARQSAVIRLPAAA